MVGGTGFLRLRSMALRVTLFFLLPRRVYYTCSLLFGLVPDVRLFPSYKKQKGFGVHLFFFVASARPRTDPSYSLEKNMSWVDFTSG